MERRGNRQTARETEKERVRVWEHCGKRDLGVRHKTGCWKNPLTSFWDKLERIAIFWETILMEKWDRKMYIRLNIFSRMHLATIGAMACRTFSINVSETIFLKKQTNCTSLQISENINLILISFKSLL
jgi:hypothetical protein